MKRVYGRITNADGSQTWVEVTTDANGYNDAVNVTWLAQVLKLNLGESPFWGTWGIPQYQTIMSQVFPTYYVMETQRRFAPKFAALTVTQQQNTTTPIYNIQVLTQYGSQIFAEVPT